MADGQGGILTVGAGKQYSTIADAVRASKDGDTLQVQAGTYMNDFATINTRITIQGVGGMAHLMATVQPPDGKAILTTNASVTIDHLEFSGAQVDDQNGAGIRYQGGDLTITNSYFHDNQEGLLGNSDPDGTIAIKNSEFARNGAGDGYSHNLYVNAVKQLTIQDSYFHDAVVGHEIKSRALSTTITGTRVFNNGGNGSYEIDLPQGGVALIQGNVIQQGPNSQNPVVIAFGEEGGLRARNSLTVRDNTIVNDRENAIGVWNATGETVTLEGNRVYGFGGAASVRGDASQSGTTVLSSRPSLGMDSPIGSGAAAEPMPMPVPTPTPTPAPTPVPTPTQPSDVIRIMLSEDAYMGDAQYSVRIDGREVGGGSGAPAYATAPHAAGASAEATFQVAPTGSGHQVEVSFLNDRWDGGPQTDRNLYVDSVQVNGAAIAGSQAALFSNGTATFAGPGGTQTAPRTGSLSMHVSEDEYQGHASYIVKVDGTQVGGTRSASAAHGAGASEAVPLGDGFSAGAHRIEVSFLNDRWDGSPQTDRNLYVDSVDVDGKAVQGASAALYSGGTAGLETPSMTAAVGGGGMEPAVPISTLTLSLSGDAYQGEARFIASLDGVQLGAEASVMASHGIGATQEFSFQGRFGAGAHDLALSFVNDRWDGTPQTDRNLYLDGIKVNGASHGSSALALYSQGTEHVQVLVPVQA